MTSILVFHSDCHLGFSSFDEYSSEVKSGRLEWSPVHKSERFWRENAIRLNENNYSLLKYVYIILMTLPNILLSQF